MEKYKSVFGKEKYFSQTQTKTGKTTEDLENLVLGDNINSISTDNSVYAKLLQLADKVHNSFLVYRSAEKVKSLEGIAAKLSGSSKTLGEQISVETKKLTYAEILCERYTGMIKEMDAKISELEIERENSVHAASQNIEDDTYLGVQEEIDNLVYDKDKITSKLESASRVYANTTMLLDNKKQHKAKVDVGLNKVKDALVKTDLATNRLRESSSGISSSEIISNVRDAYKEAETVEKKVGQIEDKNLEDYHLLERVNNKPYSVKPSEFGQKMVEDAATQRSFIIDYAQQLMKQKKNAA